MCNDCGDYIVSFENFDPAFLGITGAPKKIFLRFKQILNAQPTAQSTLSYDYRLPCENLITMYVSYTYIRIYLYMYICTYICIRFSQRPVISRDYSVAPAEHLANPTNFQKTVHCCIYPTTRLHADFREF